MASIGDGHIIPQPPYPSLTIDNCFSEIMHLEIRACRTSSTVASENPEMPRAKVLVLQ